MNNTPINLKVSAGDTIQVKQNKQYKPKPPFQMTGKSNKGIYMRLLTVFQNISPNEVFVLDVLDLARDYRTYTVATVEDGTKSYESDYDVLPIIHYRASDHLDKINQRRFTKGLTMLKDKNLVKSVGRCKYMINPNLLIPNNYDEHMLEWDKH